MNMKSRGFIFPEVLFLILIMTVVGGTLAATVLGAVHNAADGQEQTERAALLQEAAEKLKYAYLVDGAPAGYSVTEEYNAHRFTIDVVGTEAAESGVYGYEITVSGSRGADAVTIWLPRGNTHA
ncbi:MAG: type II secretion system protein [Negativicoccus succinicivorans]|uniref:type II secretion system protein n=1 Tax=Negativicoccus succinicivorans TaxID=620903 RepID=UPI0029134AD1|nr:type II secretion system protein [Negativicoccus succinicivorans]MDU4559015.1 type II secretion system protein [Negativicoccus succinicivorans]MDU4576492.1 type II secretion system protein [Negativicoccus succinicivorans]